MKAVLPHPSNLVDFVFNDLEKKIINGSFVAAQRLVISTLAKNYGISAIPIREALAKLSAMGLVMFTPNHGYRIAPHLDKEGFIQLFETRLMLDLAAVPGVLRNVTRADIKKLKSLNQRAANQKYRAKDYDQFQEFMTLNAEFHRKFIEIANNRFLEKLYDDLYIEMFISRHIVNSGIEFSELVHGHDEILQELETGDPQRLRKSLITHLNNGINLIFGHKENIVLNVLQ